jgi:hypothetical protein
MLVVGIAEATERLLGLARIALAQDDQAAVRDLLGQYAVGSTTTSGSVPSRALSESRTCSALLAGIDHAARSCRSISAGSCADQCSAARATSSRFDSFTCGTSRNITTVVRPCPLRRARSVARRKPRSCPVCLLYEAPSRSTTKREGGHWIEERTGATRSGARGRCAG